MAPEGFSISVFGSSAAEEYVVRLDHDWERRNWTRWLNCTEPELQLAVDSVGNDPDNVRRFLRQAR